MDRESQRLVLFCLISAEVDKLDRRERKPVLDERSLIVEKGPARSSSRES
jgi:hypothetical protein